MPANAGSHTWCPRALALEVVAFRTHTRWWLWIPAFAGTTGRQVWRPLLDRVPIKNIRRTVELVERRLQRRDAVLGEGLRRPAFGAMDRAQRARLAHQENLVHPHRKDLPGDILGGIAEQERANRRDLFRTHLLDFGDPRFLGLGLGRDGPDQPAPGEWRHAVGPDVKTLHVERDRFRQADDAEFRGGVIGLAVITDEARGRGEVHERAAFLLAEQPGCGMRDIERA